MKNLVILNALENSPYSSLKISDSDCAWNLALKWACNKDFCSSLLILISDEKEKKEYENFLKNFENFVFDFSVLEKSSQNLQDLLKIMADKSKNFDGVIYGFADTPFYNTELTKNILELHYESKAEYTFADGYGKGLSPEVINPGTLEILLELCKVNENEQEISIQKDSIFELLKKDINSFEIETYIACSDYRQNRFCFDTSLKHNFKLCCELSKNFIKENPDCTNLSLSDPEKLSEFAENCPQLIQVLPCFYNIQIASKCGGKCIFCPYPMEYAKKKGCSVENSFEFMDYDKFCTLIDKIADFSGEAVICLSLWGEAVLHPKLASMIKKILSYSGLSVLIELSDAVFEPEKILKIKEIEQQSEKRTNGQEKIIWIVSLDSVDSQMYEKLHGNSVGFTEAINNFENLKKSFPSSVYPQFIRTTENESQLESFFRFWDEKNEKKLIIQKYDDFADLLSEKKTADLSPIKRNVCWHLRRDFNILIDGDVPLCRTELLNGSQGNVFKQSLPEIWQKRFEIIKSQMNEKYSSMCEKCDEYYTFNF
ncbi:MAG: spiro-SPASM protein [Treponemataceae bacterium]